VSKTTMHRLGNPGQIPLEITGVSKDEHVGEDDIERVDEACRRAVGSGDKVPGQQGERHD